MLRLQGRNAVRRALPEFRKTRLVKRVEGAKDPVPHLLVPVLRPLELLLDPATTLLPHPASGLVGMHPAIVSFGLRGGQVFLFLLEAFRDADLTGSSRPSRLLNLLRHRPGRRLGRATGR